MAHAMGYRSDAVLRLDYGFLIAGSTSSYRVSSVRSLIGSLEQLNQIVAELRFVGLPVDKKTSADFSFLPALAEPATARSMIKTAR
jgi:hypothetical protein